MMEDNTRASNVWLFIVLLVMLLIVLVGIVPALDSVINSLLSVTPGW